MMKHDDRFPARTGSSARARAKRIDTHGALASTFAIVLAICGLLSAGCRSGRVIGQAPDDPSVCLFNPSEIWNDPTENGQEVIVYVEIPDDKPGTDVEIELERSTGMILDFKVDSPPAPVQDRSKTIEETDIVAVRTRCLRQLDNECICNYNWEVELDL